VEEDSSQALNYFRSAAEQGFADSQYTLALMYDRGDGVREDKAEAVKWYRQAAENDRADAQFMLAAHYLSGEGVREDKDKARYWLEAAAANGHDDAEEALEKMNRQELIGGFAGWVAERTGEYILRKALDSFFGSDSSN
jgi:TPR repeat protein